MEVIQKEEQRIYVGGGDGTASNPYTWDEYERLEDSGSFYGGYVTMPDNSVSYMAGDGDSSYATHSGAVSGSYGSNDDSDASIDSGFFGVYGSYGTNEVGSGSYGTNDNISGNNIVGGGGGSWLGNCAGPAVACCAIDGPLPIGDIVACGVVLIAVIHDGYIYLTRKDNPVFPTPWSTDRPDSYVPPEKNTGGNFNNDVEKFIFATGAGSAVVMRIYQGSNPKGIYIQQKDSCLMDTTNITKAN